MAQPWRPMTEPLEKLLVGLLDGGCVRFRSNAPQPIMCQKVSGCFKRVLPMHVGLPPRL